MDSLVPGGSQGQERITLPVATGETEEKIMSEKQSVINIPTAVSFNGHHYKGVTVHNGVDIQTKPFPCNADSLAADFQNCAQDTSGFFMSYPFRNAEVSEIANPDYLHLFPAA